MRRTKTAEQRLRLGLWRMANEQLISVRDMTDEHIENARAMLERILSEARRHNFCPGCRSEVCQEREFCDERTRPIMRRWVEVFREERLSRARIGESIHAILDARTLDEDDDGGHSVTF